MSLNPQELQSMLDELEASRASRKRMGKLARVALGSKGSFTGMELPPPARKTIDLEGRLVKDGVRKAIQDRQIAVTDLIHSIREYRKLADSTPLTLQGSEYAQAVQELDKAIDRAESLCSNDFPSDAMQNPLAPPHQMEA